ncbi:VIT domain-containing protein [Planosporangium mesophilum]|uniref:Inter-alpha-trypsin inhibitor domain-containing protein n=1 Tax=Planosporangium mesophilum TaxID=689768 RepID=A0A8J3TN23_9ACTN|nr:VIT domain-containing protein [Planosporangium mesophilum]NJC85170.1 VWA domain-containing protein [Planosporangium mesophilum]GII24315.1 inter-alpha-trypsin inhibitor domain-containing protein [Planosporangium mesophilum]
MTLSVTTMSPAEAARAAAPVEEAGLGALRTGRGNLPLDRLDVQAQLTGLVSRVRLTQEFVNTHDTALEATYVFPLPDRAAVTGMTMTADGRVVEADLRERGEAREEYDRAIAAGKRASIAEEERPDVFTMRVGNIRPGERVSVELSLVGPLPYADGAATFRFPLVVAPRYVPGAPLPGPGVGDGYALDTDAVPDASRITPPVLLPGFPNPLRLSLDVDIDPAGLPLGEVRSSLHTVVTEGSRVSLRPGERADRDFVLRLAYGSTDESSTLVCVPDDDGDEGTYRLTLLPPAGGGPARGRDVVLLLDRSGSMRGWKMVAARRAAARIVDTLTDADRFAVLTFDHEVGHPDDLPAGLVVATDRHRFRAVEHLARADARGGTELLAPLRDGLALLAGDSPREPVLVLVTDGQVGNEDQILREITPGRVRVHTVGIDRAVNAGFLGRLAALGGGRCELVESSDRLDEAMEHIHHRIGAPLVTDLTVTADGLALIDDTRTPGRLPALYPGVPLVISGRYRGPATGSLTVTGRTRDGRPWRTAVAASGKEAPAVTALWARARLRDLEDRYAAGSGGADLERLAVTTSLRFGVLCRFTAYVAVDSRVVTEGGQPHRVVQPVEPVSGWDLLAAPAPSGGGLRMMAMGGSGPARGSMMMAAEMTAADAPVHGRRQPGGVLPDLRAAVAAAAGAPWHAGSTAGVDLRSLREVAAVEARRLRESAQRPEYERRELLADLASRLTVLVGGRTEAEYEPLRRLAEALDGGGDLAAMWAEALRVLDAFAAGTPAVEPDRSRTFWKRG